MTKIHPVLLKTKLHRPRVTRTLVHRQPLFDLLNIGIDQPLTLVCAPAGFGKTTLVSSWIERMGSGGEGRSARLPAAWLSLEKNESEITGFVYYVIAALRNIFDDACPSTFDLLQSRQQPSLKNIINTLINEIIDLPRSFVLVLDDYHTIQGKAIPNLINELLLQWPRPLHLVLISRNNPPLNLSRLRVNDQLTEIRSQHLRFNKDETAEFLRLVLQTPPSETILEKLEDKMEGWIGALRVAALSLRATRDIDSMLALLDGSQATIVEYLVDEVLAQQPPAIQVFLLESSILDRFGVPLCESVIGELDPAWGIQACIDWLEREELFVIPLDDHRHWYRYHHLIQDVLQHRLSTELAPEKVQALHQKTSSWYEREGLIDEALKHALLAMDFDRVAGLVEQGLCEALNRSDRQTLERWLSLIPEELILERPWLLMIKAWILHFNWQLDAIPRYLYQVEALIDGDGGGNLNAGSVKLLRGQIAGLRGQEAFFDGKFSQTIEYSRQSLAYLPESWEFLRGGMTQYLVLAMQASGEGKAADRMLLDLFKPIDDKTNGFALRILDSLCFLNLYDGMLDKVKENADALLHLATLCGDRLMQGWANLFLGTVKYHWNELDAAVHDFTEIIDQRYSTHQLTVHNAFVGLVLVQQAMGESSEAIQGLEAAKKSDIERIGFESEITSSLRARLALSQGDLDNAFRWADNYLDPVTDHPLLWLEEPHLTRARILLARKTPADMLAALEILDSLLDLARRTFNKRYEIEILAVRALAFSAQGKARESQAELWRAVELAKPGGFLRVFVELGADMQEMLGGLALTGRSVDTIRTILAAFPDKGIGRVTEDERPGSNHRPTPGYPALVEPLTPREIQILSYLREPLGLKEIALKLDIRYATAKRHSINVYGKLGVNSRWDAVAKAIELGILPAR